MIWLEKKVISLIKLSLQYFGKIFTDSYCKNALLTSDFLRRTEEHIFDIN